MEPFTAEEVSDDAKPAILRAYLRRWKAEVGVFFGGVGPDSPETELRRISPDHPVFKISDGPEAPLPIAGAAAAAEPRNRATVATCEPGTSARRRAGEGVLQK